MSYARGFGLNGRGFYTNVVAPREINLQFTVTPTNGLGITSLKSNGYVENVFMHTSTTPASNNGFLNPNPANGFAVIQTKNNFNNFLGLQATFNTPTTGSIKIDNGATLTVGQAYVITTLGNATAAQWLLVGVPAGITPAVGVTFIAIATGGGSGNTATSRVSTPTTSGIDLVEVVGVTNVMTNTNSFANAGQQLLVQFSNKVVTMDSYTPVGTVAAPTFTGSALAAHSHILNLKNAAVADGATTRVNAGTNLLGANTGSDIAVAGGGANGGIAAVTAGTPAGTNSAPAFTGTPAVLTGTVTSAVAAPATGSICMMRLYFDGSSVTIGG